MTDSAPRAGVAARLFYVFLVAQVLAVVGTPLLAPTRWFCWAPHTVQVQYALDVTVDGRRLSPEAACRRYGLGQVATCGWEAHATANLIAILEQREAAEPAGEREVVLTYRINDGPPRVWRWSSP